MNDKDKIGKHFKYKGDGHFIVLYLGKGVIEIIESDDEKYLLKGDITTFKEDWEKMYTTDTFYNSPLYRAINSKDTKCK